MAEFYKRQVGPEFADTSIAPVAANEVVTSLAERLEKIKLQRDQDEEALRLAQFRNIAQRNALEALRANPTDVDGYIRQFRDSMREIPTPVSQQGRYGAIVESTEGQYYWTIASQRDRATKEGLKYNSLETAENFFQSGLRVQDGTVQAPYPALEIHDNFSKATDLLLSTAADGSPLFTPEEIGGTTDGWTLQVLQGQQVVDLNGNISLEALARMVDPHFDYTVTVKNPGVKPLVFRASDLSEDRRNQFRTTSVERVAALLHRESDGAKLAHAQRLWRKEEPFLPGPDKDALELLAQVQVADSPIFAENLQQHMDNCKVYVDRFGLLPEPYARAINGLIQSDNPAAAAMGAQILASLRTISDGAAAVVSKSFDDETLLRANMLHGLILGSTALDDAFKLVKTSMAMDANDLKKRLPSEISGEKERAKFYGNEIMAEVYGSGGVAEYRKMVDANFIINGGDRDSAVAVARDRINGEYAETFIGADRDWHMPFFGRKRRKFRNTPEAVYGPHSSEIINGILRRMAPDIALQTGIPCDLDHIILVPTPETDWAVEHGENPIWIIARRNDGNGGTVFYIDRDTGEPLTFSLDEEARKAIYVADLGAAAQKYMGVHLEKIAPPIAYTLQALGGVASAAYSQMEFPLSLVVATEKYQLAKLNRILKKGVHSVAEIFQNYWNEVSEGKRRLLLERAEQGELKVKPAPKAPREEVERRKGPSNGNGR
jgi:hypothetical protein